MGRVVVGSVVLSLLLSTGCVKRADYDALRDKSAHERGSLEAQLTEQKSKTLTVEQALTQEQDKLKQANEEIARLTTELEAANAKIVELQNQLADMVKNSSSLKSSIEEMQAALTVLREQKKQSEARVAEFKKLLESFKSLIDAGKLKVKVVRGRMVVELPSDVLFGSGSIDLSTGGKTAVSEIGAILVTMKGRDFEIEGHTDDQPIKTDRFPSNWELAAGRAIAVAQILIKSGLPANRISAASFGEFRPVASNKKPETRAQNRRIEIVLVPDLSKVPGFEELEEAGKQ
jgi:chemotaxis protein MotB